MRRVIPAVLLVWGGVSPANAAEPLPYRPIRLVVPYAAGGGTDITSRVLAPRLGEILGQPMVVDNRPGGGSIIGTDIVAKSLPDGHTLMMATIAFAANAGLFNKLPYDSVKDFAGVSLIGRVPLVLAVHPAVSVRSIGDLIQLAKAKPGSLNYASGGTGGANHLAAELFKSMTGTQMVHVPYKGGAGIITALLGGEVQLGFATVSSVQPHFTAGRIIPLAATSSTRVSTLPNLPTIAESGVTGYEMFDWQGVVAPAGTAQSVIAKLNSAFINALSYPEVKDKMLSLGMEVSGSTPLQLSLHIQSEVAKWKRITSEAGIKGE